MPFSIFPFTITNPIVNVLIKIQSGQNQLSDFMDITRGYEFGFNHKAISQKNTGTKIIKGENIHKYLIKFDNYFLDLQLLSKKDFKNQTIFNPPKLVTKFVSNSLIFAYDDVGYHNTNVVYNLQSIDNHIAMEYLLALLNSRLINFWFESSFLNEDELFPHIQKNQLEAIPIKKCSEDNQKQFVSIVNKILGIAKSDDYQNSETKQAKVTELEAQIDQMVYKLYDLTPDEIAIVEGG
jgi:hypothetical protein